MADRSTGTSVSQDIRNIRSKFLETTRQPEDELIKAAPIIDKEQGSPISKHTSNTYIIQAGDTLIKIAKAQDTTVEELIKNNPGIKPKALKIGAKIKLHNLPAEEVLPEKNVPEKEVPILKKFPKEQSTALETIIEAKVKEIREKGLLLQKDEATSWKIYDLRSGNDLATVNDGVQRPFASMVKPFVAVAYFHLVNEGKLSYGPEAKEKLRQMLVKSDNNATNWFIDQIGGAEKVQAILKTKYPAICKTINIVQDIPYGGAEYRNRATATDCVDLLKALHAKTLPGSKEIIAVMSIDNPDRLKDKTNGRIPNSVEVTHKTGSTGMFIGDMGILNFSDPNGKDYPVIIVGMVARATRTNGPEEYKDFMRRAGSVIREVSVLTYSALKAEGKVQ